MKDIVLRSMTSNDWEGVVEIYKQGIETGNATFQQEAPSWGEWNNSHLLACRIVAESNRIILGWGALTPVSGRCVYEGVAEVSVYKAKNARGQKIGTMLLEALILQSEAEGLWTLQSGVFPENIASIKIHENLGFRKIGYREKIGKLNGIWRDTILLERRSKSVGL